MTEAELSADIKAIFKLGHFDDVTAEVTDIAEGKVIAFIVMEKPMITEIRINGNKVLKKDEIEGVMIRQEPADRQSRKAQGRHGKDQDPL